jgi:predicted nuclease of predicted toxin-antitoxin system
MPPGRQGRPPRLGGRAGRRQAVKLLLDKMLAPAIARELTARGHDVQAVAGHSERECLSDPDVLALARAQQRAVVTNNVSDP